MGERPFATWFLIRSLQSHGWPRREGLRRRAVVDSMLVDVVAINLGRYGRAIGAVDSDLGLKLLAAAFRHRDWPSQSPSALDEILQRRLADGWPVSANFGGRTAWEQLLQLDFETRLVSWFAAEVWHGLVHTQDVVRAFGSELRGSQAHAREWVSLDLNVDPTIFPESAVGLALLGKTYVMAFQEEGGALSPPPAQLTRFVENLRQGVGPSRPATAPASGGSSVIVDLARGLMWTGSLSPSELSFDQAEDYVAHLKVESLEGWRLPTKEELESLIREPADTPDATAGGNSTLREPFNAQEDGYLHSCTPVPNPNGGHWVMRVGNGHVFNGLGVPAHVRAVRDVS